MYRYKQLISPKLSQRDYNGQVGEVLAGVKVMNKTIETYSLRWVYHKARYRRFMRFMRYIIL